MPTTGQLALLGLAIAIFTIGGLVSLARLKWDRPLLAKLTQAALISGLVVSLGVLVWHARHQSNWLPIGDNFDAFVWLASLLVLMVIYFQSGQVLRGLDWFVMPIVILLLLGAAVFGTREFQEYRNVGSNVWVWVHRATAYGGAAAFAIASTYDPVVLARFKVRGLEPDIIKAGFWYERARELGSAEAPHRLQAMMAARGN